ncbi:MAG: TIGR02221 family CRISPR-associated protein [Zetaproteobacteria bacterium]|nr:MAG: TIGR02221 family CRISPR-associated protein [Zetaproteobacteria bacterium]
MTDLLISFLGKQRRAEGGYRLARYRFDDGDLVETRYFAQALRRKLNPDRVLLLGTSGSMWDVLIEDCDAGLIDDDTRLALIDAVDREAVDQPLLDAVARAVASSWGCEVRLGLIPYGRDEGEQMAILRAMADGAQGAEHVHLDVTHGFRSLPMLALMAAFYLQVARGLEIAGIHYGMFEARDAEQTAPVVRLDGLLRFGRWIGALRQYDKDGDYSVFADLLAEAGVSGTRQLAEASFFERISDVRRATSRISTAIHGLDQIDAESHPAAALFAPELQQRLGWFREPSPAQREWALAEAYLDRGDYLRAALIALEAAVSSEMERQGHAIADFEARQKVHDELREHNGHYKRLNSLRNQMAHGSRKKSRDSERAMRDEQTLCSTLGSLIRQLRSRYG